MELRDDGSSAFESAVDVDCGGLWSRVQGAVWPVPAAVRTDLAPATCCAREWSDLWLERPGADRLLVGSEWTWPIRDGLFPIRFENRLGRTSFQPYAGERPVGDAIEVEVISSKFPTPEGHVGFLRALLDDLFARATRLPFALAAPTGRGVTEALQPPTPLFVLHFLCQYAPALRGALAIILGAPHQRLHDRPEFVPLAEVAEADADVLLSILRAPQEWVPARGFPLATALLGYAPARVWQRLPEETFDTPENRFVLAALRAFLAAAESLPSQPWWGRVPAERRAVVTEASGLLRQAVGAPLFAGVGPMQRYPAASRVLPRREGYREVLGQWQVFQHARRPLFAPLRQAMDVRDVASLYEMWCFFALAEEIAIVVGLTPEIQFPPMVDGTGLKQGAEARFGGAGRLVYNRDRPSYSVRMRPDFTWLVDDRPEVVFDAKFRLDRRSWETGVDELAPGRPVEGDIHKMHAYRDALGVRVAIAVHPGDSAIFYDQREGRRALVLRNVLLGERSGVGAMPLLPQAAVDGA